ncbi:nuclear pore complex protein NUP85 isoform X1 [Physcomitrium patens]|uniref:Nuclear pore complex protein Nup85 n=1 Tax=Physcomitrium patens TaxID=3218 RepID=A0A2K1J711_PHYPA|nr:nuclear pore complex protein NUP85-like isoform X1 [Physcomitrium patens]PNR37325.1 hypothetical protein PHYPA_020433 [Physcomitrium patens]|eukprot:XP_024397742.1 nuclear pore complex protein NUP85-like isoform X1 [Physcomitrella patens]
MQMPSFNGGDFVPYANSPVSAGGDGAPVVHTVHHSMASTPRVLVSWGPGNTLRLSYLPQVVRDGDDDMKISSSREGDAANGQVVEVKLGKKDDQPLAEKRALAYSSAQAFALLQNQKQQMLQSDGGSSRTGTFDWWQAVLEYSQIISATLGPASGPPGSATDFSGFPTKELQASTKPTTVKAIWDLVEIFYVDKNGASWLPERLVEWLASYDAVLSSNTLHTKLTKLQQRLVNLRFPEEEKEYWDGVASALAVGWLDIAVYLLRMHGSYQHDQIDNRNVENGLVETVAVLISKMPRLRPSLPAGAPGQAFDFKPEFSKAWEKWRSQVAKLDGSTYWGECNNITTQKGLKKLLKVLLGSIEDLLLSTTHWMELLVAHLLHVQPFSKVSEGLAGYAVKCVESKGDSGMNESTSANDPLQELTLAILSDDTEVVVAECTRLFDPWLMAHLMELLTAKSKYAQSILREERYALGGISLEELNRLSYAQVLCSHQLTWQLAPVYLSFCPRQGLGILETLLLKQPVSTSDRLALKVLEVCRLYDLGTVATTVNRIVGVHHWKHGRKGAGIAWLQRAQDDRRLAAVADELLESVSLGMSGSQMETLQELEGLVDLLGSELHSSQGLTFLHRYKDFKTGLQIIKKLRKQETDQQKIAEQGRQAADFLLQLLKPQVTPQRFWLPLLRDAVELLEWPEMPLLGIHETNLLLSRLQELSLAKVRGDLEGIDPRDLSRQSLERIRLALACNLGRALLQE